MHTLMVLYGQPTDPEAFRHYYTDTHLPIAQALPGAKNLRYTLNLQGPEGAAPFIAKFEADFDSAEAMGAALASPEGEAAKADTANFATGGLEILHYAS